MAVTLKQQEEGLKAYNNDVTNNVSRAQVIRERINLLMGHKKYIWLGICETKNRIYCFLVFDRLNVAIILLL